MIGEGKGKLAFLVVGRKVVEKLGRPGGSGFGSGVGDGRYEKKMVEMNRF